MLHFPILCTFSCGLFIAWYGKINYHLLALINVLLTVLLISVLAVLMHKFVEKPGIKIANMVVELFEGNTGEEKAETEKTESERTELDKAETEVDGSKQQKQEAL